MNLALMPLRLLLEEGVSLQAIQEALCAFECERDSDVKNFLDNYILKNEALGASRSYLIIDEDALAAHSHLSIAAFFSLAVTSTDYSHVSNRLKRKIMGNYPRISKEDYFPGYLLGQLARNDRYEKSELNGSALLEHAERILMTAADAVGGNIIYLDCKRSLVKYYETHGYAVLTQPDNAGFFKKFKRLSKIELPA